MMYQVRWQGTNTEGWPILVVKIAMACAQYQGDESNTVADAIIGQVYSPYIEQNRQYNPLYLLIKLSLS